MVLPVMVEFADLMSTPSPRLSETTLFVIDVTGSTAVRFPLLNRIPSLPLVSMVFDVIPTPSTTVSTPLATLPLIVLLATLDPPLLSLRRTPSDTLLLIPFPVISRVIRDSTPFLRFELIELPDTVGCPRAVGGESR